MRLSNRDWQRKNRGEKKKKRERGRRTKEGDNKIHHYVDLMIRIA